MIEQKIFGLILVILGILSIFPTDDGTAALFLVPLGLYAMCSKKNLYEGERDE